MQNIMVIGCGMIGKTIVADLAGEFSVTCVDRETDALAAVHARTGAETREADFNDTQSLAALVADQDLIIGAVPGFLGYRVLETVIRAGKDVVDISFFPEDPFGLDALAREKRVRAVVDCGVAPGLCNLVAGRWNARAPLKGYECLVGGLPLEAKPPFRYRAPFSPGDVIEEYTRPARYRAKGKDLTGLALSETEMVHIPPGGELEAFLTDGLRTLLTTMPDTPDMIEKTLRFPGHAAAMRAFREAGMFSREKIDVNGVSIAPLDITSRLLFKHWKYKAGEADFTIMRIRVTVAGEGPDTRQETVLYDEMDRDSGTMSMARTTGYTCTAVARLMANGKYTRTGISPPEYIGAREPCYDFVMRELKKRNIQMSEGTF